MNNSKYVTLEALAAEGWTEADVRSRCPWAAEYRTLDRQPCWLREELSPLLGDEDGRDS